MNIIQVWDDLGDMTEVYFLTGRKRTYKTSRRGLVEIQAGIHFGDGRGYITRLPVFTEWFK